MSLKRLVPYLRNKGISVVWREDFNDADGIAMAPFTKGLGIHAERMEIHALMDTPWPSVLHEAGHLLWGTKDDLGWEIDVCIHLGMSQKAWRIDNQGTGIGLWNGRFEAISDFSKNPRQWRRFRQEKITESRQRGMIP